jgi:CheY-like chemotaxis protein
VQQDPAKTELCVIVQDTGPGIREDDRQRIFEAFERLDYTGVGIEGSGLGLNISIQTAQLLGGSIAVDSTVGEGSAFTVTLPLRSVSEESVAVGDKQSVDILFIDDDAILLDLVSRITTHEGMRPQTCSRPSDALQLLQERRFDIIFTDIQMPDLNGFALVERIRTAGFEGAETVPIIGLSARSQLSQEEYKAAGFSGFLFKPFTFDQLIGAIIHYTGKSVADRPTSSEETKNFSKLVEWASGDWEMGKEILRTFIADHQQNCHLLEQAFDADDWETIRNISHKMLPSMKMIFADRLVQLLEQYNSGSREKEHQALLLDLIRESIREASRFINKHVKD